MPLPIIRDTREKGEKNGWTFTDGFDPPPIVVDGTLTTGDYSIEGMEDVAAVERKEFQDFIGCLGAGRERFERELCRARGFWRAGGFFVVVVEGPLSRLLAGDYRGALDPKAGEQTVLAFIQRYGVPFVFCLDRQHAERVCFDLLRHHARDFYGKWNGLTKAKTPKEIAK